MTPVFRVAGAIVGQTALLAALLLYFGWARTRATFDYFGVDLSLLDFTTTDYVLRSVNSAYRPLLWIGLIFLAASAVHRRLTPRADPWLVGAGGTLVAIGVVALLWGGWSRQIGRWIPDTTALGFAWLPATLTAGFALLAYAVHRSPGKTPPQLLIALAALVVMALFWAVSLVAVHDGRERAKAIERNLATETEVTVLSAEPLVIRGPGVVATDLKIRGAKDSSGRYRVSYGGLRMLIHSGDKFFLLPAYWRHGRDRVFQLPDDGGIRIELTTRR